MKTLWLTALVLAAPLAGCNVPDDDEKISQELNVNSRYTVENVHVSGEKLKLRISDPLRTDLDQMVGQKLDDSKIKRLAERIQTELAAVRVDVKVTRGNEPDHVIVNFEVAKSRRQDFDMNVTKFLYNSKEGWTGVGGVTTRIHGNAFSFGLLSDGDSSVERFAGIRAKYERPKVGTDRLKLTFEFDSYHEQWNRSTLLEASPLDIYRTRQVFTPEATVVILPSLEWSFGVSFARLRVPVAGALTTSKTESSNAVVNTLRYHQRWGSEHDDQEQDVQASYDLSSGTGVLESDRIFTRHLARARYRFRHQRNHVEIAFLAGEINGAAPLYDRFVLGNSETLRGWNKFELDPLGGSHVIHGSIDYRYGIFQIFYDTGAVWDRAQDREQKQSVGVGVKGFKKECFQLAVAFPLRAGHAEPVFYAGMNF
ncbi:MAG TPA: BamA/TamA family outer membrane protein [Bryobacteraceae bacterium]|nr:BamA/TamA family outer membrane protein [Bryobacteraceae bacterium]